MVGFNWGFFNGHYYIMNGPLVNGYFHIPHTYIYNIIYIIINGSLTHWVKHQSLDKSMDKSEYQRIIYEVPWFCNGLIG